MKDLDEKLLIMDETGLHIKSAEIAEKLEKKNLSASMITGLIGKDSCAARWLANTFVMRDLVEQEPDNAARRGSLFHKVMEDLFALEPEERTKATVTQLAKQTLHSEEFVDLSNNKDVIIWLRDAIKGYYEMGADPQKVNVAEVVIDEEKGPQKGLEVFVKGKIGNTKRDILGFIDRLSISAKDGSSLIVEDWKGLALDTPLPTPKGWTTMGEVQKGDKILGTNGKSVEVLNKSDIHNRPCYKIEFMDGSSVVSDNVHLWEIITSYIRKTENHGASSSKTVIVNSEELYELWKTRGRDYIQIRNPEAITAFDEKDLPISPYLLGAWLGDGRNRDAEITSGREDAEEMRELLQKEWSGAVRIRENGMPDSALSILFDKPFPDFCVMGNKCRYETETNKIKRCQDCIDAIALGKKPRELGNNVGLTTVLKREGLVHNKHISIEYLRGSLEQRISLLQGLMDTDGHWHSKRKRAIFTTTTKELSDAIAEIISTLGVTPTIYRGENDYKGYYEVSFSPVGFNPFRLKRKAAPVEEHLKNKEYRSYKALHRYIRNIEPVESVPTQCIKVDAENSLYLCGPLMTPTHNTGKLKQWKSHTKSDEGWAEQRQQLIYKILLEQKGFNVSGARLVYPVEQGVVNVNVRDQELLDKVVQDVEETDKALDTMIDNNTFEYNTSFLCHFCPLVKICVASPYINTKSEKLKAAFDSQPDSEILMKAIELR